VNAERTPLITPLIGWFLFAIILANIAGSMTNILMPIYLTELGASVGQVGLVFTLTSVVILVLQILGGWISDSIGRLRAIAIGSLGGVLGFVFMLLAPSWQWMLLALSVTQIPYALVGPSFSAFIAENSTEENRGKVYGITDTIYQVVGVIGPPLGGFLAGKYGFKVMLLVATGLEPLQPPRLLAGRFRHICAGWGARQDWDGTRAGHGSPLPLLRSADRGPLLRHRAVAFWCR